MSSHQVLAPSPEAGCRAVTSSRRGLLWRLRDKQSRLGLFEISPGHELHGMTCMMQAGLWAATQVSMDHPPTVSGPSVPQMSTPAIARRGCCPVWLKLQVWGSERDIKGRKAERKEHCDVGAGTSGVCWACEEPPDSGRCCVTLGGSLPLSGPQCPHLYNRGRLYSLVSEALPALPGCMVEKGPTPTLLAWPVLSGAQAEAGLAQQKGGPTASSAAGRAWVSMCVAFVCMHVCAVGPHSIGHIRAQGPGDPGRVQRHEGVL